MNGARVSFWLKKLCQFARSRRHYRSPTSDRLDIKKQNTDKKEVELCSTSFFRFYAATKFISNWAIAASKFAKIPIN
jgi:hypothetical protein